MLEQAAEMVKYALRECLMHRCSRADVSADRWMHCVFGPGSNCSRKTLIMSWQLSL